MNLSLEEKQRRISDYLSGSSITEIAKNTGVNPNSIWLLLKRNNIPIHNRTVEYKYPMSTIIDSYKSGNTLSKLSEKYGISSSALYNRLVKDKSIRTIADRSSKFNHDFFESIDTESKAYYLGLLIADGCVSGNSNRISICLKDKEILEDFSKDLDAEHQVRASGKNYWKLSLFSKKMIKDLSNYGVVPRKDFITYFPYQIPKELQRHFIRGVFDGDGCISLDNRTNRSGIFNIQGTLKLVSKIQEILLESYSLSQTKLLVNNYPSGNCNYTVRYNHHKDLKFIYFYLYWGATRYLERKFIKFTSIIDKWSI